jgi:hypothetical protein
MGWMVGAREAERVLVGRQRGIVRRICDANVRLMSQGFGKLCEEAKERRKGLESRLRFVVGALGDRGLRNLMAAYNGMKERKMMLEGVGLENRIEEKLKLRLVRKITDSSYSIMVAAIKGLKQFLRLQRDLEDLYRLEFERQQREKQRFLIRIMDSNLNLAAVAFRQSYHWMQTSLTSERTVLYKQRGIMRRILDANTRLLAQGYNKLISDAKSRKSTLSHKLKSLVKSFNDKDLRFLTTAYNSLKQRCRMLSGEGMGLASMKKVSLIRRLTNTSHNLQVMAVNALKDFLRSEKESDEANRIEFERQQREKDRVLRRIMDGNLRMAGTGYKQSYEYMHGDRERERMVMYKQRGIMRRILDSNVRVMAQGYNKLVEEAKGRRGMMENKVRYLIRSLTDKDLGYMMVAYHGLKQRARMLNGEGMGSAST